MTDARDFDGVRVGGFQVESCVFKPGKKENPGTVKLVLQAAKDEINTGPCDFGDILKALNTHQEGHHPIVLRVLTTTDTNLTNG